MDLLNKMVRSKAFGAGLIVEQNETIICIDFSGQRKKFEYPSCFETFIQFVNDDDDELMQQIVSIQKSRVQTNTHAEKTPVLTKNPSSTSVDTFVAKYGAALASEINYLKSDKGKKLLLFDGICIDEQKYRYLFDTDTELFLPDGTPVRIHLASGIIPAHIISCENDQVMIQSSQSIGSNLSSVEISAEPWQLLDALIDRIYEIAQHPNEIVSNLILNGRAQIHPGQEIECGQESACSHAMKNPITFVWGPPGTGKTHSLANMVLKFVSEGKRVLMLSHSNVSVDGAVMKVFERASTEYPIALQPGMIIRYGYPREQKLLDHPTLTSYNYALYCHPDLLTLRQALQRELKSLSNQDPKYVSIRQELSAIRQQLSEDEKACISKAAFVATTASKAVVDQTVFGQQFDVVMFDEASMAYVPQVVFSASLTKERFCCFGDFRQLPPIIQSPQAAELMETDIFSYVGITEAVENNLGHNWLVLLDVQRRMHKAIADFVSSRIYGGRLRTDTSTEEQRAIQTLTAPFPKKPIALLDLTGMMSVCSQTKDKSRFNILSSFVSAAMAYHCAENMDIGIITPYNGQSRLAKAMVSDMLASQGRPHAITSATVHQYQGSEMNAIIYDAVDCYRMSHPGMLLTSTKNNLANRLFNVAITRAQYKFISVANMAYFANKNLPGNLAFASMLIQCKQQNESMLSGLALISELTQYDNSVMQFYPEGNNLDQFVIDLSEAKTEIRIDIPGNIAPSISYIEKYSEAMIASKKRGVKIYLRSASIGNLPILLKEIAIENSWISQPVCIIDRSITWFGEPYNADNFISSGTTLRTKYYPAIRFVGQRTARALFAFLEMNKTTSHPIVLAASSVTNNRSFDGYIRNKAKCSLCGKPMHLVKGKTGKFSMGCTGYPSCKNIKQITNDFLNDYLFGNEIRCPQDNTSLEAKIGQYGIYVFCNGDKKHFYRLDEV